MVVKVTDQTITAMTNVHVSDWFLLVSARLFERFACRGKMLSINATNDPFIVSSFNSNDRVFEGASKGEKQICLYFPPNNIPKTLKVFNNV